MSRDMDAHNIAAFIRNREVKVKVYVVNCEWYPLLDRNLYFFNHLWNCLLFIVVHHASISEKISTPSTFCGKAWTGNGTRGKMKTCCSLDIHDYLRSWYKCASLMIACLRNNMLSFWMFILGLCWICCRIQSTGVSFVWLSRLWITLAKKHNFFDCMFDGNRNSSFSLWSTFT